MDERTITALNRYLDAFAARLGRALWWRAAAVLALAALAVTIGGSWLAIHTGFGNGALTLVRLVLLVVLASLALTLLVLPLRRLRRARHQAVEALAPEFDGRLRTYAELPESHPFRELLAGDALGIAARHEPRRHVSGTRLAVPGIATGVLTLALIWLALLGPGLYRAGARSIWAGWLLHGLLPAQRLAVDPGDQAVRRGGDITVRSRAQGFEPAGVQLYARVGNGAWQAIAMARGARDFSFTFFSLRDPISYYATADGIRSPTYRLSVVDVPNVDQLRLTYRYPDWTGRPPSTQEGSGDISAIPGTQVTVQLHTDQPIGSGELVLDGAVTSLHSAGRDAQGAITVARDARYYLAARIGGQRVRLTDDYLIKALPVPPPKVEFTWPGRDYSASRIEEVSTELHASDDYGLHALELHYSVNGGGWQTVELPASGREVNGRHLFTLESLQAAQPQRALQPGDLISYYAIARGHKLSSRSDMYFIDVQPFDRRYSQSQSEGGAGGGGSEQQDIAQREREILISTWNLQRERAQVADTAGIVAGGPAAAAAPAAPLTPPATSIHDNATLLAGLQDKLAAQARSFASRTQARELVSSDQSISRFIDAMQHAARAMQPAAKYLAAADLDKAIAPEQQALQYLLQAAAQSRDVKVSMQRGNAGGGGAQPGNDMAQLYQLEMDLHKNQYEQGNQASPQSNDQQADALARRLQSLAQRQQQLASQMQHSAQLTPEQRWQQQSLQREAEDLQQQLAQLQQRSATQSANSQGGQNGQNAKNGPNSQGNATASSGGTPGGGASGSGGGALGGSQVPGRLADNQTAGKDGGTIPNGATGQNPAVQTDLLSQRLAQAIQAMNQATNAMRTDDGAPGSAGSEQARRAAQQAGQSLGGAGTALARERAQAMQQAIGQMSARAGQLYAQQAAAERQLEAAAHAGAAAGRAALTPSQQAQLTEQKRQLSTGVQQLGGQVAGAARQYQREAPATSQALQSAAQVLNDADVADRLSTDAQYINEGAAGYVVAAQSGSTQALRELQRRLQQAQAVAGQAALAADAPPDPVTDELAQLRTLRSRLQQQADAAQGTPQGGSSGTATANAAGTGGGGLGAAPDALTRAAAGFGAGSPEQGPRAVSAGAERLVPLLRAQGADAESLAKITRLARQLGQSGSGAGEQARIGALRDQINLLDQLELQLAQRATSPEAIRAAVASLGAEQYQEAVAEYYRQLSEK